MRVQVRGRCHALSILLCNVDADIHFFSNVHFEFEFNR